VLLGESPSLLQLLGVAVILGGILLATVKVPVRAPAPLTLDAEVSSH
jgi:drug/metabolite transporter (DMT)-like permease